MIAYYCDVCKGTMTELRTFSFKLDYPGYEITATDLKFDVCESCLPSSNRSENIRDFLILKLTKQQPVR